FDWWDGAPHTGTLSSYDATDLARVPLFLREGALVPMEGEMLWVPSSSASRFVLHEEDDSTTSLDASGNELTLQRVRKATKLRVLTAAPSRVEVNGAMMAFTVAAPWVELSLGVS